MATNDLTTYHLSFIVGLKAQPFRAEQETAQLVKPALLRVPHQLQGLHYADAKQKLDLLSLTFN